MRSTNCQNIRSEIEAAGSADYLSSAAMAHIDGCAACESLSRQQNRLHSMLANLGTVEAPGDFDFKLRARLAAEKETSGTSFSFLTGSLGARAAAVAMILLVIGAGIVYLNVRGPIDTQLASQGQNTPQKTFPVNSVVADAAGTVDGQLSNGTISPDQIKDGNHQQQFVADRGRNRRFANANGSLDMSGRGAQVISANQAGESYPSAPFPINASGKRLKVSVADGRGASRTISLPSVSFGSESSLSQNPTPLMASARGAW